MALKSIFLGGKKWILSIQNRLSFAKCLWINRLDTYFNLYIFLFLIDFIHFVTAGHRSRKVYDSQLSVNPGSQANQSRKKII